MKLIYTWTFVHRAQFAARLAGPYFSIMDRRLYRPAEDACSGGSYTEYSNWSHPRVSGPETLRK